MPSGFRRAGTPSIHLGHQDSAWKDTWQRASKSKSRQAWRNIEAALREAGADLAHVINVRQWLVDSEDASDYVAVRSEFIRHRPTFMLGMSDELIRPGMLVEIEVIAAIPGPGGDDR